MMERRAVVAGRVGPPVAAFHATRSFAAPRFLGFTTISTSCHAVIRLTIEPEMPESFPVREIHQTVNCKYVEIDGHQYLLPATSTVQSRTAGMGSRNEIEFRRYQKYAADTTITFDDADETPQQTTVAPKKH